MIKEDREINVTPRYFVRFVCRYPDGSFDIHEDNFYNDREIIDWAVNHSYIDIVTRNQIEWRPHYVYDRKQEKDITSKFN